MPENELPVVEVTAKRPFPKLLALAVGLFTIAMAIFIIDAFKKVKIK